MLDKNDIDKLRELSPFFTETIKSIFEKFNEEQLNYKCALTLCVSITCTFFDNLADMLDVPREDFNEAVIEMIKEGLKARAQNILH